MLAVFGALLLAATAGVAVAQGTTATAQFEDADGNPVGTAEFSEGAEGVVVTTNLQPGQETLEPGEYGIHIHETGSISPDFETAGAHFNPTGAEHGLDNPNGPHAGDLENITVEQDGSANYQAINDRVSLSPTGENSLFDSDGSALVIHAMADDNQTDPSGESGDRLTAGVIQESITGEATTEESTTAGGVTTQDLPGSGGIDLLTLVALSGVLALVAAALLWLRASR
jgi:Cu/Zn superoxide dismutase